MIYFFEIFLLGKTDKSDPLETHLTPFIQTFKDIFCFENEEIGSEDTDIRKLSTIAINTLTLFANQIPTVGSVLSVEVLNYQLLLYFSLLKTFFCSCLNG